MGLTFKISSFETCLEPPTPQIIKCQRAINTQPSGPSDDSSAQHKILKLLRGPSTLIYQLPCDQYHRIQPYTENFH